MQDKYLKWVLDLNKDDPRVIRWEKETKRDRMQVVKFEKTLGVVSRIRIYGNEELRNV